MNALIGYTGFVGQNLTSEIYSYRYNSKNIDDIIGKQFETVVCAGVRAEKFLANAYPEVDLRAIEGLIEILRNIECEKFILISTIDIYKNPQGVDENSRVELEDLHAYGFNRHYMEEFVRSCFKDYLIVRLPALFGKGLKKNFIYDMLHKIPSIIMNDRFNELLAQSKFEQREILVASYTQNSKGNWEVEMNLSDLKRNRLKEVLESLNFTSLMFTDYRSKFPFYDLSNLQSDIDNAIQNGIKELNIAVEPVSAAEVAKECFGVEFTNTIIDREPVYYDMKTIYADKWDGKNGYMYSKEQTLSAIKEFVERY